jgi:hypothetical protein
MTYDRDIARYGFPDHGYYFANGFLISSAVSGYTIDQILS